MASVGLTRRHLTLGAAAGACGAAVAPVPGLARARDVEYGIRQIVGNAALTDGPILLDLPSHSDTGTSVPLTIGIDTTQDGAEIPAMMHVFADENPRPDLLGVWFTQQSGRPLLSTRIRLETAQTVTAIAQLQDGRVWRAAKALTVNFGACADVGTGSIPDIRDFKPVTRVSVPKTARPGEIISIRALISHPMETGLRLDGNNSWVPRRIIEEFNCSFNGDQVIRVQPYPAVATNPYFAFFARATKSGVFTFSWLDTNEMVFINSAAIEVQG